VKRLAACAAVLVAFGAATGPALAQGSASPRASCVGTLVSFEATELPAGFVGHEVSEAARSQPGIVAQLVRELAKQHGGSVEACLPGEE
jgi:hypothetical protein